MAIGAAFLRDDGAHDGRPGAAGRGAGLAVERLPAAVAADAQPGFSAARPSRVVEPAPEDRRFRDQAWSDNALFDFIKQSYLLTARWMQGTVKDVEGLDEHTARKVDFYTRQFVDAIAPSNFVLTNPEVLRATIESRGENLRQRPGEPARRSRARQGPAGDQHDRHDGVQDRRERRRDAGQGRLPERPDAADPIRADDRRR